MNIHHVKTNVAEVAGKKLSEVLGSYGKKPILFLISGGSSLQLLEYVSEDVLGSHVTCVALDERFSRDADVNNFLQIKQTSIYDKVIANDVNAIDTTPEENENIEGLETRWHTVIKLWLKDHPKGNIIATAGIGEDGHIAGMMPFPDEQATFEKLFMDPKKYIVGYDAGNKNKFNVRITSTMTLLSQAVHVISYVVGESKRPQLIRAQESDKPLHECPSRILSRLPNVDVYTDIVL